MSQRNPLEELLLKLLTDLANVPEFKHGDIIDPEHHNTIADTISSVVSILFSLNRGGYSLNCIRLTPLQDDPHPLGPGMLWFIYKPEEGRVQLRFTPDGKNIYTLWSL